MVTQQQIRDFLVGCGIRHDDVVTIHCSLRAIGEIEGGADGLIDAFCAHLSDGLFLVPTHTWDNVAREHPFYDVKTTEPCIGTLAKIAAFRTDAVRSLHPTHSMAAFGKRAADYVRGEEHSASPAPVGGCLSRLYEENGKVLLIGVGHERNTYLHAVDERLNLPDRLNPDPFVITIQDANGNCLQSPPFHTHYTAAAQTCVSEYYPNYKQAFLDMGVVREFRLGNAAVSCCDARKMTEVARTIWDRADHDLCLCDCPISADLYR